MKRYADNLRTVNLFSDLKDNELETISRILYVHSYQRGQLIFQEGENGDALFVVLKGKVKVCLYDEEGREYVLDIIGKDGFFGELALIDDLPRSANAIAMEAADLLVVRRSDFVKLLMENPSISVNILRVLAGRLRAADERIKWLAFLNVEGRILKYLLEVGARLGIRMKDYVIIERGPSQIEIANSCGCSRETVSRMVSSLVKKGVISVRRRQYTLHPGTRTF
ncbi:MAG TPA: Crp/Fnr family transcriptional regulator [Deltaproteobacteria bacterium]|nr:Crp/Fnr family transcriptional regulator [Deltaproteobacteria bacterium]